MPEESRDQYRIFVAEVASTCNEALLIHDLMDKTEDELTRVRNLGKKSVDEIKEKLTNFKGLGIGLKDGNAKD